MIEVSTFTQLPLILAFYIKYWQSVSRKGQMTNTFWSTGHTQSLLHVLSLVLLYYNIFKMLKTFLSWHTIQNQILDYSLLISVLRNYLSRGR